MTDLLDLRIMSRYSLSSSRKDSGISSPSRYFWSASSRIRSSCRKYRRLRTYSPRSHTERIKNQQNRRMPMYAAG